MLSPRYGNSGRFPGRLIKPAMTSSPMGPSGLNHKRSCQIRCKDGISIHLLETWVEWPQNGQNVFCSYGRQLNAKTWPFRAYFRLFNCNVYTSRLVDEIWTFFQTWLMMLWIPKNFNRILYNALCQILNFTCTWS